MTGKRLFSTSPRAAIRALALLIACPLSAQSPVPCFYIATPTAEDPRPGIELHADCAHMDDDGSIVVEQQHLSAASYGSEGHTSMHIAGDWYLVKPSGEAVRVLAYDNGPDEFSDGLVRTLRRGCVAYLNLAFEEAIPPRYDWGWPFKDGRALVCLGCRVDESGDGEHHSLVGGKWGYIDTSGAEVVPVRYSRKEAIGLAPTDATPASR